MNESITTHPYAKLRMSSRAAAAERPATIEFVGASDDTIAEAVRHALARASKSLRTLEGAGVVVIPHIDRHGTAPRFQVTLQITAGASADASRDLSLHSVTS